MKKLLSVSAMALVLLAGCSSATSYYGESAADEDGNVYTVSFDKDGEDLTNVVFDVVLPESEEFSSTSKYAVSQAGEYGMEAATGKAWYQHVDEVTAWVEENDAFPTLDADGYDVDGVTGATIHINEFEEAFENATEQA